MKVLNHLEQTAREIASGEQDLAALGGAERALIQRGFLGEEGDLFDESFLRQKFKELLRQKFKELTRLIQDEKEFRLHK